MKSKESRNKMCCPRKTVLLYLDTKRVIQGIVLMSMLAFYSSIYAAETFEENSAKYNQRRENTALRLFKFDSIANSYLHEQKTTPVCLDFLSHLNNPRKNQLFEPDGSLVHESEKIKSVYWETLEKERYRSGFMSLIDDEKKNLREQYINRYADPHRTLQRTKSYPIDLRREGDRTPIWLYRLVPKLDLEKRRNLLTSITWFPKESIEWLGDENGNFSLRGNRQLGLGAQMFTHNGITYGAKFLEIQNKSKVYLHLSVYQFYVDLRNNAFLKITCEFQSNSN